MQQIIKTERYYTMELLEETKFIIGRYDHYYDSINNKGNLYLVLNTFIAGGVISGYYALDEKYHFGCFFKYLLLLTILINVGSTLLTLLAIKPYFSKRKGIRDNSLYYFGDVAGREIDNYDKTFTKATEEELLRDSLSQVHKLACGLNSKFKKINVASILIGLQVILILFFMILLTFKY